MRDLFVAPSFDELDAVAVDCKGEPRKLTGKQLESIRERGYAFLFISKFMMVNVVSCKVSLG